MKTFIIIVSVISIFLILGKFRDTESTTSSSPRRTSSQVVKDEHDNSTEARVIVWNLVKARLRNPGDADFSTLRMTKTPHGTWVTSGYVDSSNAFGGAVRTYFSCEIKHAITSGWVLIELNIE